MSYSIDLLQQERAVLMMPEISVPDPSRQPRMLLTRYTTPGCAVLSWRLEDEAWKAEGLEQRDRELFQPGDRPNLREGKYTG